MPQHGDVRAVISVGAHCGWPGEADAVCPQAACCERYDACGRGWVPVCETHHSSQPKDAQPVVYGEFTVTLYAESVQAHVRREHKICFACPRCGEMFYVRDLPTATLPNLGFNEYIGFAEDVFGKVSRHACPAVRVAGLSE
jgi:predicted RNA-binding Zn-ribbon protein involved in translation (DUF1610 family)